MNRFYEKYNSRYVSEFDESKAHEFDRYICNEILEEHKKSKLYRDS